MPSCLNCLTMTVKLESNWLRSSAHEEPSWEDPDIKKPKWISARRVDASKETLRSITKLIVYSNLLFKLKRVVAWIHRCKSEGPYV